MGNRNGRCWKEPTSGRKGMPRLNLRKGSRLGVTTEMEGQTGRAAQSLMESQLSRTMQSPGVPAL